jgi:hypothetical protein
MSGGRHDPASVSSKRHLATAVSANLSASATAAATAASSSQSANRDRSSTRVYVRGAAMLQKYKLERFPYLVAKGQSVARRYMLQSMQIPSLKWAPRDCSKVSATRSCISFSCGRPVLAARFTEQISVGRVGPRQQERTAAVHAAAPGDGHREISVLRRFLILRRSLSLRTTSTSQNSERRRFRFATQS